MKVPREKGPRVNRDIRVPQVRLINDLGEQVGIVDTSKALEMAKDKDLDLVEVSPNAKPPVCKIIDYGKFKYDKKKKESVAKKKQVVIEVKELQFRPKTDIHDFDFKVRHGIKFLENGDKVKVSILFRGREITRKEMGNTLIERIRDALKDYGEAESDVLMEGRKMTMVFAPNKKKRPKPVEKKSSKPTEKAPAKTPEPSEAKKLPVENTP